MGFILSAKVLVTVRFVELRVIEAAKVEIARIHEPSSACVFVLLQEAVVDRVADLLEAGGAELDALSHKIFRTAEHRGQRIAKTNTQLRLTLVAVGQLGDRLGKIRGSLL